MALMLCDPAFSDEVLKLALPPLRLPVPSTVDPSLNLTASPFGGVLLPELTVAVNCTRCPKVEGFRLELSVVVVGILSTFWINFADVLPTKFGSPL
jgi:hypothetical protein